MKVKELKKYLSKLDPNATLFVCIGDVRETPSDYCPINGFMAQHMEKISDEEGVKIQTAYGGLNSANSVVLYLREVEL